MRRFLKIILVLILILFIAGAGILFYLQKELDKLILSPVKNINLMEMDDGVYKGSYSAFPVSVIVDVTIKDHKITEIGLVEHSNGQGKPAEVITQKVIEEQSLDVDSISGATYSSKVILKAIEDALTKAEN